MADLCHFFLLTGRASGGGARASDGGKFHLMLPLDAATEWVRWANRPPLESLGKIWKERRKEKKRKGAGKRGRKEKKRDARKKGKMEREKREILKGEEENLKWKGKVSLWKRAMSRGPFFFFCLSLFETTEICLGCTKMEISMGKKLGNGKFSNPWLHIWLCPWMEFYFSRMRNGGKSVGPTFWEIWVCCHPGNENFSGLICQVGYTD